MASYDFISYMISSEINLNEIAGHFGINKKFKWEEPLILKEKNLKGIISKPDDKYVYVFSFGSVVFINMAFHETQDTINYLKKIDKNLRNNPPTMIREDFKLYINPNAELEITYNSVTLNKVQDYHFSIIATILAKSVALEKIEEDIDILLDKIEDIVNFLEKGKLNLSDENLAKMSSKILRFKYNTISYIMLLDKPKIAWENEVAENFYSQLSELFELNDRYDKIKHKTELLLDITEIFSSLTQSKRGTKLEWMIIILILIELLLSLIDKIFIK